MKMTPLGERTLLKRTFPGLDAEFKEFQKKDFLRLPDRKKSERVSAALLERIEKTPAPCFLLSSVLDFIARVEEEKILEHYTFTSFELWLNHFSGLSPEENYAVRGKIAGKFIDRSDYQLLFPIGMGKVYEGTHFVTAHKSPDLDTTVASFWGWLDAFAARVGDSLHVWNLPGGPPPSQIEIEWLFRDILGEGVFTHLPKTRTTLSLTAHDLMTQEGFSMRVLSDSIGLADHEKTHTAIVIIDGTGHYLGDWRSGDVEGVRQVIILLSSCLRWFENTLHLKLISLLAKPDLVWGDIEPLLTTLFHLKIQDCEPAEEFGRKQRGQVADFITKILGIPEGISSDFETLGRQLAKLGEVHFTGLDTILKGMKGLFDKEGHLLEARPQIFAFLEKAVSHLHQAIFKIRVRLEKFDIALKTKKEVFGRQLNYVTGISDVEEIKSKMAAYPYLTVATPDKSKLFPLGVIPASILRKPVLGTVSLRDFCNREEMGIPSYLEVISVIDHHKSELKTATPPMAIIADAQSCNALVAEQAFRINDRYSLGGESEESIDREIEKCSKEKAPKATRLLRRLLERKIARSQEKKFFVHPERETLEYLQFLYAILDDTDLLSKVSVYDVECVAELLNRLKSLQVGKEVEILNFEGIAPGKDFPKRAAERILRNEEMYSLYKKVYEYRETEVEKNLSLAVKHAPSNIFADTKEQNGCCRVGQTKMFASNLPFFEKHADAIRKNWLKAAEEVSEKKPEIDLHIHMMSTIVSADEVYKGTKGTYPHKDELWIWIPEGEAGLEHLKRFLNAFQGSPGLKNNTLEVEFLGENGDVLAAVFGESFTKIPAKMAKKGIPIAVLRYNAGSLNSRKAMISPFLPAI